MFICFVVVVCVFFLEFFFFFFFLGGGCGLFFFKGWAGVWADYFLGDFLVCLFFLFKKQLLSFKFFLGIVYGREVLE